MPTSPDIKLITALKHNNLDDVADACLEVMEIRNAEHERIDKQHEQLCLKIDTLASTVDHFSAESVKRWEEVRQAFPNKDIPGHRKYHESLLRAADAQTEFWTSLKLDLIKKGTWSVIIIVIGLVVAGLSTKLGLPK